MDNNRRNRLIALCSTFLTGALLLLVLLSGGLSPNLKTKEWPPRHEFEIVMATPEDVPEEHFVETFSMQGDNVTDAEDSESDEFGASDITSDEPTQTSYNAENRGNREGRSTPPTTTTREQPVQVKPNDNPGNQHPDPAQEAARAEAERQQRSRANINAHMQNRFSGGGNGQGKTSDIDGTNASDGPGNGTGHGMTMSVNQKFNTSKTGVLIFTVVILPDGSVKPGSVKGPVRGSTGPAATDDSTIRAAKNAAAKCKFQRRTGETNNLSGTIRFTIEE